jgi:Flp pilus assembly protein TadD
MEGVVARNPVLELILHLGFGQLKDGLYEDAISTFSAARLMDLRDDRPLRGRGQAYERMRMALQAARDFEAAEALRSA